MICSGGQTQTLIHNYALLDLLPITGMNLDFIIGTGDVIYILHEKIADLGSLI